MNIKSLAVALRNKAVELRNVNVATAQEHQTLRDAADLIRVLSCVAEGKSMAKAFGAPGDWGYETPIGAALYEPADIPELGAPVDQAALLEQYRITCEAQQQTIERLRGVIQASEAGG